MSVKRCILGAGAALASIFLVPAADALETFKLDLSIGNDDPLQDTLIAASTLSNLTEGEDTTARDVIAAAQSDYTTLLEALYANGYYSGRISILLDGREAAEIDPFGVPDAFQRAQVIVNPGPRFTFGTARITPLAKPQPALAPGEPALATVVRDAAQGAVADWRDTGHAKARIADQSITARHQAAQLDVDVAIDPGPRLRFGEVTVSGDSAVREARIRQIAGLPRGEVFMPSEVETAANRLRRTGTFASVQITEGETPRADGTLDMDIAVVDRKPRRIGGGIELSSLDGLTLSGYWLHRNFFGGAERLRIDGEIAQIGGAGQGIDYSLSVRIEKPAVYGADTMFYAEAGLSRADEPDFLTDRAELTLGVSREFSPTLTGDLGIAISYAEITDRFTNAPNQTREMLLFSLPAALTWDTRDDPLDATDGYYLMAELEPFYNQTRGEYGARFALDGRAYRAVGDRAVLAGRLQLGSYGGTDAVNAPPDMLFYSGGGGTVRGQPYQSLDADYGGVSLGGRSLAVLSAEARIGVTDNIGVVAFADYGVVGTESFGGGSDWHAGAGLGLRYKTPVGPIRFDVAGPVGGDTGDGVQLYIGIGQAF